MDSVRSDLSEHARTRTEYDSWGAESLFGTAIFGGRTLGTLATGCFHYDHRRRSGIRGRDFERLEKKKRPFKSHAINALRD